MGLAQYAIVAVGNQWGVLHDGDIKGEYLTKEALFEAATATASIAVGLDHEVHLSVASREESGCLAQAHGAARLSHGLTLV